MKQGWGIKRIVDVAEKIFAGGDKPKLFSETETDILRVPVYANGVTNNGLCGYTDKCTVEQKCITISARGTIGFCCIRDTPFVPIVRLITIIPSKDVDLKYLYYAIGNSTISNSGTSIPQLTVPMIRELLIPVPPIAEQKRIVEILDREFEKIDALKANAERSLQQVKDLFQSALKQELQPQDKWIKSTIGETCILKSGNSNANYSSVGTLPFVKVGDMNIEGNEESITCSSTYVSRDENIKGIFPVGSVIFPKRGGAILTNKKRITTTDICCDLNIMGVYSKGEIISELLYLYFLGVDLSQIYNGAAIPQINNGDIAPLHISFPKDVVEQQYIVAKLNKLRLNCKAVEENYTKTMALCDDMKQALLRQAFNGEL